MTDRRRKWKKSGLKGRGEDEGQETEAEEEGSGVEGK
jgi:hypothetical protein